MSSRREAMLEAACEYIRNAGGAPSIEQFDDDHEPVGPMLREVLKEVGLVWEREGKIREVTVSQTPRFGSLKCDYTGTPPFADAEWAGKENDESEYPMCEWCAGTGHPYGDESYGICECPALRKVVSERGTCPWDTDGDGDCHRCSKRPGGCFWHGPEGEGCIRNVK